jgi:hypothetical protein
MYLSLVAWRNCIAIDQSTIQQQMSGRCYISLLCRFGYGTCMRGVLATFRMIYRRIVQWDVNGTQCFPESQAAAAVPDAAETGKPWLKLLQLTWN